MDSTAGNSLLSPDIIGTGLAGLVLAGLVIRGFVKGWIEARTQAAALNSNTGAMVSAVSIGFTRDEITLLIMHIRDIAEAEKVQANCMVAIAQSQAKMAETEMREMKDDISQILKRMEGMPEPPPNIRRR